MMTKLMMPGSALPKGFMMLTVKEMPALLAAQALRLPVGRTAIIAAQRVNIGRALAPLAQNGARLALVLFYRLASLLLLLLLLLRVRVMQRFYSFAMRYGGAVARMWAFIITAITVALRDLMQLLRCGLTLGVARGAGRINLRAGRLPERLQCRLALRIPGSGRGGCA